MLNQSVRRSLVFAVVACAAAAPACRSARKGVRVGASSVELKVVMEGLATEDAGKTGWIYELSSCLPDLNGSLSETEPNVVVFKAPGLKRELKGCQLRLKVAQAPADVRFVAGAEANVLYWARDLIIRSDAKGALVASAPLQKLFDRVVGDTRGTFALKVKVNFPSKREAGTVTGSMQCQPAIVGVGSYTGDSKQGELLFLIGAASEQHYDCREIYVNIDGHLQVYRAELGDAAAITAAPGAEASVGPVALVQQVIDPTPLPAADGDDGSEDNGSIQVSTSSTEQCSDNEVFDISTYRCVARSSQP